MDQTQQKALNALEPYVLLAKSATSPRAAIDLITQATSAPNAYVFAELLQTPNIQTLRTASPEHASYLTLLEIFAWGTWTDYQSTPNLPPLSDAQSTKLRQLTLLTLAPTPSTLTYPSLLSALSLPTTRDLEDLVISSIYAGLLTAKLSPLSQHIDVSSVSPLRDLHPNSIPTIISVLEDWDSRCVDVLGELEERVKEVRNKAEGERRREGEYERVFERAMGEGRGKGGEKRGARDDGGDGFNGIGDVMEVDEGGRGRGRNAKRGGRFAGMGKKFGM